MARGRPLIKVAVGLAILAGLAFVFLRTLEDARSAPYSVDRSRLAVWDVAVESTPDPQGPLLVLQADPQLTLGLFQQVFARTAESLHAPAIPAMPLVLQREFTESLAGVMSVDDLGSAARAAGLESATFEPRCLAVRRLSGPGDRRHLFFLIFDVPEFDRFRDGIARLLEDRGRPATVYDPAALSPILVVASSNRDFHRWLPLRADPDLECVAPVIVE